MYMLRCPPCTCSLMQSSVPSIRDKHKERALSLRVVSTFSLMPIRLFIEDNRTEAADFWRVLLSANEYQIRTKIKLCFRVKSGTYEQRADDLIRPWLVSKRMQLRIYTTRFIWGSLVKNNDQVILAQSFPNFSEKHLALRRLRSTWFWIIQLAFKEIISGVRYVDIE